MGGCNNFSVLLIEVEKNNFFYLQYYEKKKRRKNPLSFLAICTVQICRILQ